MIRSDAVLRAALRLIAQLSFVATAFILLARSWWFFDLFTNFRVQLVAVQLLLLAIFLVLRRPMWAFALGVLSVVNGVAVRDYILPLRTTAVPDTTADLRVLTANVQASNTRPELLVTLIRESEPDIFAVLELTGLYADGLSELGDLYPHQVLAPELGNFGIGVYSRLPFADAEVFDLSGYAAIDATIDDVGTTWHLVAAHPMPPIGAGPATLRNRQLAQLAEHIRGLDTAHIVVGDLNVAPFSPHFTDFAQTTALSDALHGLGPSFTWPSFFPLLGIPIDYVLMSAGFESIRHIRAGDIGSDHFPVIVDINRTQNSLD